MFSRKVERTPRGRPSLKVLRPDEAEQHAELDHANQTAKDGRLRVRALIVMLAAERGMVAAEIAVVVRMHEHTIRRWLVRYRADGLNGLADASRPGAAQRATRAYRERLLAVVRQRLRALGLPFTLWTGDRLSHYLAGTGVRMSRASMCRLLRAGGVHLNRPQQSITRPDPAYA